MFCSGFRVRVQRVGSVFLRGSGCIVVYSVSRFPGVYKGFYGVLVRFVVFFGMAGIIWTV